MPNLFSVSLDELSLDQLDQFLDAADPEPLLWEAKGTKLDPHEVRKQCGGFANSERGGHLILGASRTEGSTWQLDGLEFPDHEPHRFVTSCLQEGLRPIPSYDVRSFDVAAGRQVAVVEVAPLLAGPCIVRGTVYERVAGATVPVKDPTRLSDLYAGGARAQERARAAADGSSQVAMEAFTTLSEQEEAAELHNGIEPPHRPSFAIWGVAPVTPASDLDVRLFRLSTRDALEKELQLLGETSYPLAPEIRQYVQQDRRVMLSLSRSPYERDWGITVAWDGSVAIGTRGVSSGTPGTLVEEVAKPAFETATRLLKTLNATGPVYTRFWAISLEEPQWKPGVVVRRGPHDLAVTSIDFDLLGRELSRAVGLDSPEPEP